MSARLKTTLRAALAATALVSAAAHAGGPLGVNAGVPFKYPGAGNVTLRYDLGNLGVGLVPPGAGFSNAQAATIVTEALNRWTNVSTATLSLTRGLDLTSDQTELNYTTLLNSSSDGINPVIYDNNGLIIDAVFGLNAKTGVLGFAGSQATCTMAGVCTYTEGRAVINGFIVISSATMTNVLTHEIGHLIGMDHSQLDSTQGLATSSYPIMYPIAYRTLQSLHEDDIAAVTALYPDSNVNTVYGTLTGNFTTAAGAAVRGANIYAQGTGGLFSSVSDYLLQNNGAFRLLLPPGTYTLRAEAIDTEFTGGSSVGPYSESWNDLSFQPPLYAVGGIAPTMGDPDGTAPTGPMTTKVLGGGTPTTITITAGCLGNVTFRMDNTGSVTGNCTATPPATPVTANPSGTVTTTTPTYLWTAVAGATSYDLLVQTPGGADVFLNNYTLAQAGCPGGTGACAVTPANALTNGSSYNWFVRARNAAGASGFSTFKSITVNTVLTPPAPVLAQPNGTITSLTPTFLWTPAPGSTTYDLIVTGSAGGFSVTLTLAQAGCPSNAGACGYTPAGPLVNGVAYSWQVRGNNASGSGPYSTFMNFTTNAVSVPSVPVPAQPNGTISNTTPTYLWTPSPGATGYTVMLNGAGGYSQTLTLVQAGCPSNAGACAYVQPSPLAPGAYTWQIRANNAAGSSAFSTAMAFTVSTVTPPPVATPVPAQPNGSVATLTPFFLWTPATGATGYVLRVVTSPGGVVVVNNQALTLTQAGCPANSGACGLVSPVTLTAGTSYTWQVAASNAGGTSAFSTAMGFSTPSAGSPPSMPAPGAPSGLTASTSPLFLWTPGAGATAYTLQVQTPGGALVTSATLTLTQAGCPANAGACGYTFPAALAAGTAYQWVVRGENATGNTAFTAARSFSTPGGGGGPAPVAPTLGNPAGPVATLTPFYLWTPSPGATSYTLEVRNGATVAGTLVSSTVLTLAQASCPSNAGACGYVQPTPLSAASTYTWRLSATNASGTSAFSSGSTFFTP